MSFCQTEELTARELECLCWSAKGLQAKQVADKMGISTATVNTQHLPAIRRKLGAANTREAVALAIYYRLIQP
ncbi:MAG: helix-turn-helix transcriptional regulator [Sterolibacteriaceae bacterium MAG5]|nr:helix-turn-helix transcriptional regulator [Candidatus Nitricoxidireducens bremensis]